MAGSRLLFPVGVLPQRETRTDARAPHDRFRVQTQEHLFQNVIDSLLDVAIFIFIGTILPFPSFGDESIGLQAWRLVVLGVLILLLRRLPAVMVTWKIIPDLRTWQEAAFAGYFGPIGCARA